MGCLMKLCYYSKVIAHKFSPTLCDQQPKRFLLKIQYNLRTNSQA